MILRRFLAGAFLACIASLALAGTLPQLGSPVSYSSGSITLVQTATPVRVVSATTSSISITPSGTNDLLVFMVATSVGGGALTITDSNGTLQTAQAYVSHSPGIGTYFVPTAASGVHTLNVTFAASSNIVLFAAEFSSAATGFDQASVMATGSSVSPLSASITPAAGGELVIGLISVNGTSTYSGWGSSLVQQQGPTSSPASAWAWVVQGSATSASASATISPTNSWAAEISAFN